MNLSALEQMTMLAILRLHPDAYGVTIQDQIGDRTGKAPSIGSVYAALDRLEGKGLIESRRGEPTAERGGRAKLYFTLTASGSATLEQSLLGARLAEEGPQDPGGAGMRLNRFQMLVEPICQLIAAPSAGGCCRGSSLGRFAWPVADSSHEHGRAHVGNRIVHGACLERRGHIAAESHNSVVPRERATGQATKEPAGTC